MNVCIIGAKERSTERDREQVEELMDLACEYYPNCVFVTMLTHYGVGKFCKDYALRKDEHGRFRFQLVEVVVRVYAQHLSKSETSQIYRARNATPFELGDLFYYFAPRDRHGTLEELIDKRIVPASRPYKVLLPDEEIELIKVS